VATRHLRLIEYQIAVVAASNRQAASDRDDFADAIDFMGWFTSKSQQLNGVSKWDAYNQYLNYHEGWGGFRRGTYLQKSWLPPVARKVDERSKRYAMQMHSCKDELSSSWF